MADPRLNTTFPIKQFARINPDDLVTAINALVGDINATLLLLGANTAGFVTMKQLRRAMVSQGNLVTYNAKVSADITNEINILWTAGHTVAVGDDLYNDIATQLGKTPAQMITLFTLAGTFPP